MGLKKSETPDPKKFEVAPQSSVPDKIVSAIVLGFTGLGIVFLVNFLLTLAAFITFPKPDVELIHLYNVDNWPMVMNVQLKFPARTLGQYIHLQLLDDVTVSVDLLKDADEALSRASRLMQVVLPGNREIQIEDGQPTIMDFKGVEIQMNDAFGQDRLQSLISGAEADTSKVAHFNVVGRVVLLSLGIPLQMDLNLNIKKALKADKEGQSEPPKESESSNLDLASLLPKAVNFESGNSAEVFAVSILQNIPSALIPKFLKVDVPATHWIIGQKKVRSGHSHEPFLHLSTTAVKIDAESDSEIKILLETKGTELEALAQLIRAGVSSQLSDYALTLTHDHHPFRPASCLLGWLQRRVFELPLGIVLDKEPEPADAANKEDDSGLVASNVEGINEAVLVSLDGGVEANSRDRNIQFILSIKILKDYIRKRVPIFGNYDILQGQFPALRVGIAGPADGQKLAALELVVDPFADQTISYDAKLAVTIYNLQSIVAAGFRFTNNASPRVEQLPGFHEMTELIIGPKHGNNIFDRLLSLLALRIRIAPVENEGEAPNNQEITVSFAADNLPISLPQPKPKSPSGTAKATHRQHYKLNLATTEVSEPQIKVESRLSAFIADSLPHLGDDISIVWKRLAWILKYEGIPVVGLEIDEGKIQVDGSSFLPFSGGISMAIFAETGDREAYLGNLQGLLKAMMKENDLVPITMGLDVGDKSVDYELKLPIQTVPKLNDDSGAKPKDVGTEAPKQEKESFLNSIVNPIAQIAAVKDKSLFMRIKYPQKDFCSRDGTSASLLIDAMVFLPALRVNLCSRIGEEAKPEHCFASGGTTDGLMFKVQVMDGEICWLKNHALSPPLFAHITAKNSNLNADEMKAKLTQASANLPEEPLLEGAVPVYAGLSDIDGVIKLLENRRRGENVYLTLGAKAEDSFLNALINTIGGCLVNVPVGLSPAGKVKDSLSPVENDVQASEAVKQPQHLVQSLSTASIHARIESKDEQSAALMLLVQIPEECFAGADSIQTSPAHMFKWPAVRWGNMSFTLRLEKLGQLEVLIPEGWVEMKKDGVFLPTLRKFGVAIRMSSTDSKFGSSQAKHYLSNLRNSEFNDIVKGISVTYAFKRQGLEADSDVYQVEEDFSWLEWLNAFAKLKSVLSLAKPNDTVASDVSTPNTEENKPIEQSEDKFSVVIRNTPGDKVCRFEVPCLVPAVCDMSKYEKAKGDPLALDIILKNALAPLPKILAKGIQSLNLPRLPQRLWLDFVHDGLNLAVVINGHGVLVVGLKQNRISRLIDLHYGDETAIQLQGGQSNSEVAVVGQSSKNVALQIELSFTDSAQNAASSFGHIAIRSSLTPFPPVLYDGKGAEVMLEHRPLVISLGVEDPMREKFATNLLSKLIGILCPNIVGDGIGLHKLTYKSMKDEYKKDPKKYSTLKEADVLKNVMAAVDSNDREGALKAFKSPDLPVTSSGLNVELPSLPDLAPKFLSFLSAGEMDIKGAVVFAAPWPAEEVSLVLPKRLSVSVDHGSEQIFQFSKIDRDQQLPYTVFDSKGVRVMGTYHICPKKATASLLREYRSNPSQHLKASALISLGDEVQIRLNVAVSTSDIMAIVAPTWAKPQEKHAAKEFAMKLTRKDSLPAQEFAYEGNICLLTATNDQRGLTKAEKSDRISRLDFGKTLIYYQSDRKSIVAGQPTTIYLQLRTAGNLPVCGLPDLAEGLGLVLLKQSSDFLITSGRVEKPVREDLPTKFLPEFSLFEVIVDDVNPGIYNVYAQRKDGWNTLVENVQIYVQDPSLLA